MSPGALHETGHPALRRMLRTPGVVITCFAQNAKRRWYRVLTPDGRRTVISVPTAGARAI